MALSPSVLEQLRSEAADHDAADFARQLVVLDLFRRQAISTGVAVGERGPSILDFMRLASTNDPSVCDTDKENLAHEIVGIPAP